MSVDKRLKILGTRGIPARHGGFETFAERLALYLVAKDWDVIVYCQENGNGNGSAYEDSWNGVRRVHVPVSRQGAFGTIVFDWKVACTSAKEGGLMLVLGYNTALFNVLNRVKRQKVIMNMDGIEWKRQKWSAPEKVWLYLNERAGSVLSNHLIADNPEIQAHLARHTRLDKITMIPYGADSVKEASTDILKKWGLKERGYCIIIARAEPENSILEMVSAFSRKKRGYKLVVLGGIEPSKNSYHSRVMDSAGPEVIFPGAVYERESVEALRFHCTLYLHGHSVGGTNPSLVEALGAGAAVLAHDNCFNRWVAGPGAMYFKNQLECANMLDKILGCGTLVKQMKKASLERYAADFEWDKILRKYENVLSAYLGQ